MEQQELQLGEICYLRTDTDQKMRILTGICIRTFGKTYELSCGEETSWHYPIEISLSKDYKLS